MVERKLAPDRVQQLRGRTTTLRRRLLTCKPKPRQRATLRLTRHLSGSDGRAPWTNAALCWRAALRLTTRCSKFIDARRARHRPRRAGAGGVARARAARRAQHRPGACRAGVSRGVDVYPRAAARARGQGGGARAARVRAGPRRRRGAGHAPREPPPQRGRHAAGLATGPGRQGPRRAHVMHMHAVLLHLERLKHEHTMHRSAPVARSRRRPSGRRCFWARPRRPKVAPAAAPSRASCPTARPRKRRTT